MSRGGRGLMWWQLFSSMCTHMRPGPLWRTTYSTKPQQQAGWIDILYCLLNGTQPQFIVLFLHMCFFCCAMSKCLLWKKKKGPLGPWPFSTNKSCFGIMIKENFVRVYNFCFRVCGYPDMYVVKHKLTLFICYVVICTVSQLNCNSCLFLTTLMIWLNVGLSSTLVLKYFNISWIDCHDILDRYSW